MYPSGAAFRTAFVPITPLPPGLFSTTTACFSDWERRCAMTLASTSVPEPGDDGTIIWIGRVGHGSCAWARPGAHKARIVSAHNVAARKIFNLGIVSPRSWFVEGESGGRELDLLDNT